MSTSKLQKAVALVAAAGAILAAGEACEPQKVDTRSLFAKLTYPDSGGQETPNELLQLYAALQLETMTAYRNPRAMAVCLRNVDYKLLRTTGDRLGLAGEAWSHVARDITLPAGCTEADDPALVRYVLMRIAGAVTAMARVATIDEGGRKRIYGNAQKALGAIANLLERTSPSSEATEDAPALALSGGSANGAFTAGFMFELLSLRERALLVTGDQGKYRFSALVGTSVGSLISQLLDLYFVDPKREVGSKQEVLAKCNGYWAAQPQSTCGTVDNAVGENKTCFDGWPNVDLHATLSGLDGAARQELITKRPWQMCALTNLYRYFTNDDEQTLMCVEPGSIGSVVGVLGPKTQNLMRFDPMSNNVIEPLLAAFATEMLENDVPRVVVSVEIQQNQIVGLDERACKLFPSRPGTPTQPGGREYCLDSGVMASAVLPLFARPVRHVYTGLDDRGNCGTWLDGGLRSGFPVYRALRMTRPALKPFVADDTARLRVLAIDTGRLQGLPSSRPEDLPGVGLNAVGQMASQNMLDEVVMAQQMAILREKQLSEILAGPRPEPDAGAFTEERTPIEDMDSRVSAVFVPTEVPSAIVAEAGYSFDRYVMRGLWVWGRVVALDRILNGDGADKRRSGLLTRLGWKDIANKMMELAASDRKTLEPWSTAYRKDECAPHRQARIDAGRRRINECVADCKDATVNVDGGAPRYFSCPNPQ